MLLDAIGLQSMISATQDSENTACQKNGASTSMSLKTFHADGVVLLKGALDKTILRDVITEYNRTTPEHKPIPKHRPLVIYWTHVPGARKKLVILHDMPYMEAFVANCADIARPYADGALRLLETIIFNKPPREGTRLNWHQDVSYFPFEPNNQIALWIPFDEVTKENGAVQYALGSHLTGLRASTDLHSGEVFVNEERAQIPQDPAAAGYTVRCMEMSPGDVLLHDGRTWHMSGPNTTDIPRRGLSIRFLVGDTHYKPNAGSAAAFLAQIRNSRPGEFAK